MPAVERYYCHCDLCNEKNIRFVPKSTYYRHMEKSKFGGLSRIEWESTACKLILI